MKAAVLCDIDLKRIRRAVCRGCEPPNRIGTIAGSCEDGRSWRAQLGNEQGTANRRESLEKTIAKILHRYCNFGWANYYIPGEKFPSLIEELVEIASPPGQVGYEELVHFFLRTQRTSSAQERAAKLLEEFAVYRRT
jgi:hypothetical protein